MTFLFVTIISYIFLVTYVMYLLFDVLCHDEFFNSKINI